MRGLVAIVVVLGFATAAVAQPCAPCTRGDAVIAQFSLQPLRSLAHELAALELADPLTPAQYAKIVELRQRHATLVRLGAVDEADLPAIAAALCNTAAGACTTSTTLALRCFADRCAVAFPPDPRADVIAVSARCRDQSPAKPRTPLGLGVDWGTGWQSSRHPTDGRAWSFGIETRMRFGRRLGAVARVDRIAGRDEGVDDDGDGTDDVSTGSITRISALAGPSLVLDNIALERTQRVARLDLLAGWVSTRSHSDESGPALGFDLAYQLTVIRLGVRVVQGFGDAREATMVLAHAGFLGGSVPPLHASRDACAASPPPERRSPFAIGFDLPLGGYGISKQLGYLATGLGFEAFVHLSRRFDVATRADLLLYPGGDRDRVIHQAVLGGLRIDHKPKRERDTGFFTTVLGGYSHGAALTPTRVGSGPIVDLAIAWGGQGSEGAANLRLHGRFGVGADNRDYRALFLSFGVEMRLDPESWRDRS